jgi:hypothetical protein
VSSGLGDIGTELSDMIPSQGDLQDTLGGLKSNFDNLVPDMDNLGAALSDGASELTGGLSDSLMGGDYQLAMDQLIELFGTGSITRSTNTILLKMVGGGYVTVAVGPIEDKVGARGRRELIGGAKFSFARGTMTSSVDLAMTLAVGAHAGRTSAAAMRVMTVGNSAITVAADAKLVSSDVLTIKGSKITVIAAEQLVLEGGGQKITMTPSSITIVGKVDMSGSGSITALGQCDITP